MIETPPYCIFSNSSITSITHLSRHLSQAKLLSTSMLRHVVIDVIDKLTKKHSMGGRYVSNSTKKEGKKKYLKKIFANKL